MNDCSFFAGLTGDNFAQIYAYGRFRGDGVTDYLQGDGEHTFAVDDYGIDSTSS
jgi:hypothetical protein